jgi:hypothetical protein
MDRMVALEARHQVGRQSVLYALSLLHVKVGVPFALADSL